MGPKRWWAEEPVGLEGRLANSSKKTLRAEHHTQSTMRTF